MTDERDILDRLIRIEVKLDQSMTKDGDHETRIRGLEQNAVTREQVEERQRRTLAWAAVLVGVLGVIVSAAVSVVIAAVT